MTTSIQTHSRAFPHCGSPCAQAARARGHYSSPCGRRLADPHHPRKPSPRRVQRALVASATIILWLTRAAAVLALTGPCKVERGGALGRREDSAVAALELRGRGRVDGRHGAAQEPPVDAIFRVGGLSEQWVPCAHARNDSACWGRSRCRATGGCGRARIYLPVGQGLHRASLATVKSLYMSVKSPSPLGVVSALAAASGGGRSERLKSRFGRHLTLHLGDIFAAERARICGHLRQKSAVCRSRASPLEAGEFRAASQPGG